MRRLLKEETLLGLGALGLAGIAPNLFPAAQAGFATMQELSLYLLLPTAVLLLALEAFAVLRGHARLAHRIAAGAAAGLIATIGLEAVRITSFQLGGMPGDLPRLIGVLITDRFMLGPSTLSDVLGWSYHFYNGAAFGILFVVLLGRRPLWWSVAYGQLVGLGFLLSPVVDGLGIGFMGSEMPSMPFTVVLAHLLFGLLLGWLSRRWVKEEGWLLADGAATTSPGAPGRSSRTAPASPPRAA